jgi:hypothetical protein
MFLIDLEQGRIVDDEELKNQLANSQARTGSGSRTSACGSTRSMRSGRHPRLAATRP